MSTGRAWTESEIIALGVRCSVADAASILGIGKHKAYRMIAEGTFPVPWYEVGDRKWVQTRPIRELLGIEGSPLGARLSQGGNGEERAATPLLVSVPKNPTPAKGEVRVESTRRR